MRISFYFVVKFFCINLFIFCLSYNIQADETIRSKAPPNSTDLSNPEPLTYVLSIAERIKEPSSKFEALIEIATAYTELGENKKAKSILSEALDIAQNIKNQFSKAIFLSKLIDRYISLNEDEKALDIAKNIEFSDSRSDALVKIVNGYIQQGQYKKAQELTESIDEEFSKALALCKLINNFKKQELYEETLKIKKIIEKSSAKVKNLIPIILMKETSKVRENLIVEFLTLKLPVRISRALIVMGKKYISLKLYESAKHILSQAILVSKNIKEASIKSETLSQIAIGYTQIGEYKMALETVNSIKIPFCRSMALTQIAISYAQIEKFENALKITEDIDPEYLKEEALSQIIIQYIKSQREKEAINIVDSLGRVSTKARIYSILADYYIQNGEYEKAIEISKVIEDRFIKFGTLLRIAKNLQNEKKFSAKIKKIFSETIASFD